MLFIPTPNNFLLWLKTASLLLPSCSSNAESSPVGALNPFKPPLLVRIPASTTRGIRKCLRLWTCATWTGNSIEIIMLISLCWDRILVQKAKNKMNSQQHKWTNSSSNVPKYAHNGNLQLGVAHRAAKKRTDLVYQQFRQYKVSLRTFSMNTSKLTLLCPNSKNSCLRPVNKSEGW